MLSRRKLLEAGGAVLLGSPFLRVLEQVPQRPLADVRAFGAQGNGEHDDTMAFQAAIASIPNRGGTVHVPRGTYLVNAEQSIRLRSRIHLLLDLGAVLRAIPNASPAYAIVKGVNVNGIRISGGRFVGERAAHSGTAGEWGMGIDVRGCTDVMIERTTVEACWGDGIYVGYSIPVPEVGGECRNVRIENCTLRGNRRQGISVTGCLGAHIVGCVVLLTQGTEPQSGIDLEPDGRKRVEDVVIERCRFEGNAGDGVLLSGAGVSRVKLLRNRTARNGRSGLRVYAARDVEITQNVLNENEGQALIVQHGARDIRATGNVCSADRVRVEATATGAVQGRVCR